MFISSVTTLEDTPKPIFQPGPIRWITLKARTNSFKLLTSIEGGQDGFTIPEGGSIDFPIAGMQSPPFDMHRFYWANAEVGQDCVVEIIGQKMI